MCPDKAAFDNLTVPETNHAATLPEKLAHFVLMLPTHMILRVSFLKKSTGRIL
jgi:hypothetical protein